MFLKKQSLSFLCLSLLTLTPHAYSLKHKNTPHVSTVITSANFVHETLNSHLPVILKVSATWCPPCQRLAPVFEEVALEYKDQCKFASLDFDSNPEFVAQHNIDSVPTFMIYFKGKLIGRQGGCPPSTEAMQEFVQAVLQHCAQL